MPMCRVLGCNKIASKGGQYCSLQHKIYATIAAENGQTVVREQRRINGSGYYGGGADQPHVHVYGKGAHLKLGRIRYNLVQNGKKYSSKVDEAYAALDEHALGPTLRPWVGAALSYFRV